MTAFSRWLTVLCLAGASFTTLADVNLLNVSMTRPGSCTRISTQLSPGTGRPGTGQVGRSGSPTAVPASRHGRCGMAWKPMWSPWLWVTTSTPWPITGLVVPNWQSRFPNNASPHTSTIVFLVRKGNPKWGSRTGGDLAKPGVAVITPTPRLRRCPLEPPGCLGLGPEAAGRQRAEGFRVRYRAVQERARLDSGARGATTTFVERGLGDVLIAWENEALLAVKELGKDKFEIVVPASPSWAEPPVAVRDKVRDKHGTRLTAQAYLDYLYSEEGQEIAARHYHRPTNAKVGCGARCQLSKSRWWTVDGIFGGGARRNSSTLPMGEHSTEFTRNDEGLGMNPASDLQGLQTNCYIQITSSSLSL